MWCRRSQVPELPLRPSTSFFGSSASDYLGGSWPITGPEPGTTFSHSPSISAQFTTPRKKCLHGSPWINSDVRSPTMQLQDGRMDGMVDVSLREL